MYATKSTMNCEIKTRKHPSPRSRHSLSCVNNISAKEKFKFLVTVIDIVTFWASMVPKRSGRDLDEEGGGMGRVEEVNSVTFTMQPRDV